MYVEILQCENPLTSTLPSKMLDNTLRFTRSEEDLTHFSHRTTGSPRTEFSVYGSSTDFDDADCWSQEDDEIMSVSALYRCFFRGVIGTCQLVILPAVSTFSPVGSLSSSGLSVRVFSTGIVRNELICGYANEVHTSG